MASFLPSCHVSILRFRLYSLLAPTGSCRATFGLATENSLWSLFISLLEPIFIPVLRTRILLLYPSFFPMAQFKLLGSMYMPMPTEKSTFDNACSNTR